ncbi:PIN domain-containing protein [Mycolicibacterium flavescens]|uniref:Ribonuclease VapC n=1 Tax=Mycolicibacterium flavescens TaxID=1776 RepID=A0A1E3RGY4_MYCFV|nr:PIN domain-containing protein [Mycolicibacterium flavescens]MCV7279258.1 PIN domain-containing protein [Mycolicibacterium flavescens]ODQ89111.1 twitching motility protein PilT [Mycolicibacterium flavescens]
MALTARYLVDTSAAARMRHGTVAAVLAPLIESGLVATSAVLDAEAFYSARTPDEFAQLRVDRRAAYEYLPIDDEDWQDAIEAQFQLARTGRHRSVGVADLLTAVLARTHGLTVLHYDSDFETASSVVDFPHRWVAAPGSL